MPDLAVKGTKNKRETPEESKLGRWGPESGPPAAGSVLTGKRRIMGLDSGHARQVQLSDSWYTQGFSLSSHHGHVFLLQSHYVGFAKYGLKA